MAITHDETNPGPEMATHENNTGEMEPIHPDELKNLNYEMLLLGFSLLSVFNVVVLVFSRDQVVTNIINIIDVPLTIIFLFDFFLRLSTADSKSRYFFKQYGWADLAASLPLPGLKVLRLFRVFRAVRMIRFYGWKNLMSQVSHNRADAALAVIAFAIVLVLEFGAMAMIASERTNPDANIKTSSDAIWWAFVTITTVGYGDRFPITNVGRLIGMAVMMVGVGLFGVLTGYLANAFLTPSKEEDEKTQQVPAAATEAGTELAEIKRLLIQQQQEQKELRAMLAAFMDTTT